MDYISILQQSIDYIEDNIKTEISPEELANQAGFSLFHFYRIFQIATGKPIMEYITRRRLLHAIYHISTGETMVDVALTYGFDTYSGFYKAFKRQFHMSPRSYISSHTVSKPFKINLSNKDNIMLTHKKIKEILQQWSYVPTEIKDKYYTKNGIIKENSWTIDNEYILKVGTNINQIINHIKFSKLLSEQGLVSSLPITTTTGDDFYIEDDIYYYFTKKLDGAPIMSGECYLGDYEANAHIMGQMIGTLHNILKDDGDDILTKEANLYHDVTTWAIPKVKMVMDLPENIYEDYINEFQLLYPLLPKQLIHRNPNPSNVIIKAGKLSGFIDFDISEKNVRLFDPCYLSTAILSESFVENKEEKLLMWSNIYKNIMLGYNSYCPLTDAEIKSIPYIILSIQFIFVAWLIGKDEQETMLETNKKMLSWLAMHKDLLTV